MRTRLTEILTSEPQSRKELCEKLGISDRELRRQIAELRSEGWPIVSNSQTSGYWFDTGDDFRHYIKDARARALSLLNQVNKMQIRRQLEGQQRWNV